MTDGRVVMWVRKHFVGLNVAIAVLWFGVAATYAIRLVNGDAGTNGGHVFGLVLALLIAVLTGTSAVVAFAIRLKESKKGSSQRVAR